jgi:hypothetical protein
VPIGVGGRFATPHSPEATENDDRPRALASPKLQEISAMSEEVELRYNTIAVDV